MFQLPVVIDARIKAECWTYYKTCIIEAFAEGRNWLATHMNVILDENYGVEFGDRLYSYPPYYYDSILEMEPVNIIKIKPERVVEYIKKLLCKKYYIIMDFNVPKIVSLLNDDFYVHEQLIYGYDDSSKVFYMPLLDPSKNQAKEGKISYEAFVSSYKDIRNHYSVYTEHRIGRSFYYSYPISKVRLKKYNPSKETLIYRALWKIDEERNIRKQICTTFESGDIKEEIRYQYSGLGCLKGLESMLARTIKGDRILLQHGRHSHLTRSLVRLYEHRINFIQTFNLLEKLTNNYISKNSDTIARYVFLAEQMNLCYNLAKKWDMTENDKLLESIRMKLEMILQEESVILQRVYHIVKQYLASSYMFKTKEKTY